MNEEIQAFPRPSSEARDGAGIRFYPPAQDGMTLRDWFAGMALSGMASEWNAKNAAKAAYSFADEMILQREVVCAEFEVKE